MKTFDEFLNEKIRFSEALNDRVPDDIKKFKELRDGESFYAWFDDDPDIVKEYVWHGLSKGRNSKTYDLELERLDGKYDEPIMIEKDAEDMFMEARLFDYAGMFNKYRVILCTDFETLAQSIRSIERHAVELDR